jgi:hypothetical protein
MNFKEGDLVRRMIPRGLNHTTWDNHPRYNQVCMVVEIVSWNVLRLLSERGFEIRTTDLVRKFE